MKAKASSDRTGWRVVRPVDRREVGRWLVTSDEASAAAHSVGMVEELRVIRSALREDVALIDEAAFVQAIDRLVRVLPAAAWQRCQGALRVQRFRAEQAMVTVQLRSRTRQLLHAYRDAAGAQSVDSALCMLLASVHAEQTIARAQGRLGAKRSSESGSAPANLPAVEIREAPLSCRDGVLGVPVRRVCQPHVCGARTQDGDACHQAGAGRKEIE